MIWHILKKDLRLLWVFALVVAAVRLAAAGVRFSMGLFHYLGRLVLFAGYLELLSLLGIAVLTIAMMYQDAVPGVRQDWLIRPIKRGDLILAKLLFLMLFILGPVLLVDLGEGLADGFGFRASLGVGQEHIVTILCFLALPAMMLGAVTQNVIELFVLAAVGVIIVVACHLLDGVAGTGLDWMISATWYAFAIVGSAVVISLQFFRRQTTLARCLIGAGGGAVLLSAFLPWHTAFALQEHLSKEPSSARGIVLTFSPQLGPFKVPQGAAEATSGALYVPLRVTGVPTDSIVLPDRANIRITDIGGRTLYEGGTYANARGFAGNAGTEVRQLGYDDAPIDVHQPIYIPAALYAKLSNQPVRMEIDYSLTLFRAAATQSIAANDGHGMLESLGRCATTIDAQGNDVQLRCLSTDGPPRCLTAFLEHTPSGLRNPETHRCYAWYNPFPMEFGPSLPGALTRVGVNVAFFDRSGLTHYPVDGSKIADSRLVIKTYEPRDHFTRHLTILAIRLADFVAVPAGPGAQF